MFPYLAMLALPSGLALTGAQRTRVMIVVVGVLYFVMIGFRFQVGADWNNYIFIYNLRHSWPLWKVLTQREPGYGLLMWAAGQLGWGIIFVNVFSGLVFTWGLLAVAKRCREPFIAVCVATPLLVVAFAMSGVRQAIAAGLVFYLMATWGERSTMKSPLFRLDMNH